MPKKANGEGSITKRKDGRWMARVSLPGGRRKAFYGATKDDVRRQMTAAMSELDRGMPVVTGRQTMAQFLKVWLEGVKTTVRPRTYASYEQMSRVHIEPELGKVAVARLTPQQVQRLYAKKLEAGLSGTTVAHIHAVLHRALEQAVRWGLAGRNITELTDAPRLGHKEMETLSPDQVKAFLKVARAHRLEALFVLAITTGMRQGELLGLRWVDVDLDRGSVQVRANLQRVKGGFVVGEPKTARSRRQILLAKPAVDALHRHRARQAEERLRLGPDWEDHGFVFTNTVGQPLDHAHLLNRVFRPLLKEAECPAIRFHDLRHTAATLLLSEGIHPKVVSEMLGHSQIAVTIDLYSHVTPTMQQQAAAAMESLLG